MVVEHIHGRVMTRGRRRRHAKTALEILLLLVKKTTLPLVDTSWINELLRKGASGNMDNDTFNAFLRLSARRNEEDTTADAETAPGEGYDHVDEADLRSPGGTVPPETPNLEDPLFIKISQNVQACSEKEGGWHDDAVYGGLIAMKGIPQLGSCLPDEKFLETLSKAMKKGEKGEKNEGGEKSEKDERSEENKPFRVRKAAYDVILAAQDRWLRSPDLRQKLEEFDFPRQLYSVVVETGRSDHQRSFLMMMEILSEDRYWHSYLRESMDIWMPLRNEGPHHVLRVLTRVSEMPLPEYDGSNPPLDKFITKLVEDEWAGVPGRLVMDLAADRLEPLGEVTMQLKELLFTESGRKAVLAAVDQVIPSLERRRDDGYPGPGEDIHDIVDALQGVLRTPMLSTSRRSTYW
jgi:hypothetical protein